MSLRGRGILITRPREQAGALAALVQAQGGQAIVFPVIEIVELPPPQVLEGLVEFDLAVFVSPTAVEKGLRLVPQWPAQVAVAAVGPGTRKALAARGIREVIAPRSGADSEALLCLPELRDVAGRRVLVFRGEGGREVIAAELTERGARVEYAECYRRVRPSADPQPVIEAWRRGEVHAVTAFSGEAVENLWALLDGAPLGETPWFVPHARIAETARCRGAREVLVAGPAEEELAARLVAYFRAR
jgi:uroporphyrinogen-III synthase